MFDVGATVWSLPDDEGKVTQGTVIGAHKYDDCMFYDVVFQSEYGEICDVVREEFLMKTPEPRDKIIELIGENDGYKAIINFTKRG